MSLYKQYRPCHTDYTIVITPSELKIITEVLGAPCCRMGLSLEVGSFSFPKLFRENHYILCGSYNSSKHSNDKYTDGVGLLRVEAMSHFCEIAFFMTVKIVLIEKLH